MKKLIVLALMAMTTFAYGQDAPTDAYIELLRSDIRAGKVELITQVMEFTAEQSSAFWPLHREYELELSKINDDKVKLIKEYAQIWDQMTNQKAREMVKTMFDLQEKRLKLKKSYYKKFEKALSSIIAAKFIQLENQINTIIDMQIAQEYPLIQ
ncbi:MAG: hypothetical protein E2O76_17075 [Caldithrix sp.]|nr:MAG: hypothetical protein E2O76_17075 [Caldithrix sp.]